MNYRSWRKRVAALLSATMIVSGVPASTLVVAAAESPNQVTASFGTPFIDGEKDAVWDTAQTYEINQKSSSGDVRGSIQATAKVLWDDNALYVYAEVLDDNLNVSASNAYEQDSIEIFLDELYDKASSYQEDDVHYRVNYENMRTKDNGALERWYTAAKTFEYSVPAEENTVSGNAVSGNEAGSEIHTGYVVEGCLKFDAAVPQNGAEMGFDLQVNVAAGGTRQGTVNIFDTTGNAYSNPSLLGKLVLDGKAQDAVSGAFPYSLMSYLDEVKAMNVSVYTPETAAAVTAAIADAEGLLAGGNYTQEQLDAAENRIVAAIRNLDDGTGRTKPEAMTANSAIPDIFTFEDGVTAVTAENWDLRAAEIKELYEYYMYGVAPDTAGETVSYELVNVKEETRNVSMPDGSTKSVDMKTGTLKITIAYADRSASFNVAMAVPVCDAPDAKGYPMYTEMNMGSSLSSNAYYAVSRGYAAFAYDYAAISPDDSNHDGVFYTIHPYGDSWDTQSGKCIAWSWGGSKILDAMENGAAAELGINAENNILSGVSRLGKTAAVGGAYDERIKVVVPSCSGYGGLAMYRYRTEDKYYDLTELGGSNHWLNDGNETLGSLQAAGERVWFNDNFMKFDDVNKFPVDQHYLASLVADPDRYLFMITGVTSENWNGAESQTLTFAAAKQVYDMLGIGDHISICTHLDGHAILMSDMVYLLDYCDVHLYGQSEDAIESDLRDLQTNVYLNEANYKPEVFGPYISGGNIVTDVNVEKTVDVTTTVREGAPIAEIKAQLPTAILYLDGGLRHMNVAVDWDLSEYDGSAAELTLSGTVVLPDGVTNPGQIPMNTTTKLVVKSFPIAYGSAIADGETEDSWTAAKAVDIANRVDGNSEEEGTAELKVMWDEAYLYLLADVTDSDVVAQSGANEQQDSISVTIAQDINAGKEVKNYVFTADGEAMTHTISCDMWSGVQNNYGHTDAYADAKVNQTSSFNWWTWQMEYTTTGWTVEACIPWEELGMDPTQAQTLAIEAIVNNYNNDNGTAKLANKHAISLKEMPNNVERGQVFSWATWGFADVEYNAGLYAKDLTTFVYEAKGDIETVAENIGRYDFIKYIDGFAATYVEPYPVHTAFDEAVLNEAKTYALSAEATKAGIAEKKALLEAMAAAIVEENHGGKMMAQKGTPVVDGLADDALWENAYAYYTDKDDKGQYAEIKTLWDEEALYALVKVYDPTYDVAGSDAHTKDSVEFFFIESADAAQNSFGRNGGQWRINRANQTTVTFGANEPFYGKLTEMEDGAGYIVEARIAFADSMPIAPDYVMNFDIAVNLCENGGRTAAVAWTSGDCYSNPKTAGEIIYLETSAGDSQVPAGYNPYALTKVLDKALMMNAEDYNAAEFATYYNRDLLQQYYDEAMSGALTEAKIAQYYSSVIEMMSHITYDGKHPSALGFEADHALPDPFTFEDGSKVETKEDWALRHDEIQDLYEFYMYGKLPEAEATGLTKAFSADGDTYTVTTARTIDGEEKEGSFTFKVYLPEGEPRDSEGWPYIINYGGNISGAQDAGLAVIDYGNYGNVASNDSYYNGLFYKMYPECKGDKYATGVGPLAARAWGAGLIIDAVEAGIGDLAKLNPANSAVTGFSFLGKTALVTGVLEDRIAVTNPAHSGIGGAAMLRYSSQGKIYTQDEYGFDQLVSRTEPIGQVQGQGMAWVKTIFADFIGADSTPFDTHMLLSLVAPRGLYISAGYKDNGTDPEGMFASYINAKEVYKFLDAEDHIAYGNFPTDHATSDPEWQDFFSYCNYYFYGDQLPENFFETVYDNSPDQAIYKQITAPAQREESEKKPVDLEEALEQLEELLTTGSEQEKQNAANVILEDVANLIDVTDRAQINELELAISSTLGGKSAVLSDSSAKVQVRGVTGALLNVAAEKTATLTVADAVAPVIPAGYTNAVALDIKLKADGADAQIKVPVTITVSVPVGIDTRQAIKVIHYKTGGAIEILDAKLNGTSIEFTTNSFSTFAIVNVRGAEKPSTPEPENSGESSGSSSGGSDNSSSSVKEPVPVVTNRLYTVVKGDTLSQIAAKNHMSLKALLQLNPQIKNPNRIYVGQKIVLGAGIGTRDNTAASNVQIRVNAAEAYYIVVKGDYLYKIARTNGITLAQLVSMNPAIASQKYIFPGQKIRVK